MRPATQRLAAVDEANIVLDHAGQVNVFLVAGLLSNGGFVGPDGTPDFELLRSALRERIAELPPLRKVPVAAGRRHRWDEVSPDLEHHVRLVEAVDGLAGLERLCGELMSVPLGLDRPLWEILIVPGASPGQVGVVLRIHHAVADGMAAVAISQRLFDPSEPGLTPASVSSFHSPCRAQSKGHDATCGAFSEGSASACTASG
ncbi:wax ester/triacylglycerol synthase domain-containing protein [Agromyces ramosus]|uniref:diacylglycerol O-acyltransferase n=1 Tax=Agromyces ramosus TaxID=33879 RepID=A0ABU0R9U8_9MICO|nr:wax ester/triacylglycerol synthase domain-containing protein [Agromyces ramosus]MDQ0894855.1 hypothetical protein [Agromyces ramosus]